jgi:hypothetical protein
VTSCCCRTKYITKTETVIEEVKVNCATEPWPELAPVDPFYECTVDGVLRVCADPAKFGVYVTNDNKVLTWAKAAAAACGIPLVAPPDSP